MATTTPQIKSSLHSFIDSASESSSFVQFLDFVDFDDLQQFMHDQINKMESDVVRSSYYECCPINYSLSDDGMQHILSFGDCNQNRTVCRQWNKRNLRNEEKSLRSACQSFDNQMAKMQPPPSSIWILHNKRPKLHPVERESGYRGIIRCTGDDNCRQCTDGSVLLVPEGEYDVPDDIMSLPRRVSFLGLGPRSCIEVGGGISELSGKKCFQNLRINTLFEVVGEGTTITFKNCIIDTSMQYMTVGALATLNLVDCQVTHCTQSRNSVICALLCCSCEYPHLPAIAIEHTAKRVNIINCTFKNVDRCVCVNTFRGWDGVGSLVRLKVTDNVFENTSCQPIIELTEEGQPSRMIRAGTAELNGNTGNSADGEVVKANTICHEYGDLVI